ncbi:hypothetical protein AAFF_G00324050 [Aldrovandia affinis]|uniref:Transmembrane 6 superfamily member 1/2 transmembrane domain-containing protein n=1 Tax=Aldrovandia affinis TaxID=143900 RepID=A0AAD7R6L4_9TELE|nr:hypothetical protein AAFF_G00324050 [Aldrovandia affinis]
MNLPQEVSVYLFSLSALGVLYTMNNVPAFQHPLVIPVIGVTVMALVFLVATSRSDTGPLKTPSSTPDQRTGAGQIHLRIHGVLPEDGEPYIVTAYAIMMSYWDGLVHFLLYLFMVQRMANEGDRSLGLFWAGSLSANMAVFVYRDRKYGSSIRPTYWLNLPFLLAALWGAVSLLNRPRDMPIIPADRVAAEHRRSLLSRPLDLLLLLLLLAAAAFTIFRAFVVLDCGLDSCFTYIYQYEPYLKDPVGFPDSW